MKMPKEIQPAEASLVFRVTIVYRCFFLLASSGGFSLLQFLLDGVRAVLPVLIGLGEEHLQLWLVNDTATYPAKA